MKEIKDILGRFGLSEKEITVYLSLLSIGAAIVSKVAKDTKLNRSTVYVILDSLVERKLVNFVERTGGVRIYTALPAEKLADHLADVAKTYSDLAKNAKKLVPQIKKQFTSKKPINGQRVQIFEGKTGMKTVYEDALGSLETIRAFAFSQAPSELSIEHYKMLKKKGIKVNVLTTGPGKGSSFSPEISVYEDKISLVSPAENFAIIIESAELAEVLKKTFDKSWVENNQKGHSLFGKRSAFGGA